MIGAASACQSSSLARNADDEWVLPGWALAHYGVEVGKDGDNRRKENFRASSVSDTGPNQDAVSTAAGTRGVTLPGTPRVLEHVACVV
jgi:hypothetical protein